MTFITSIAIILLSSLLLGNLFKKLRLPSLIGMLLVGIILGPYVLNLISIDILNISNDLRQFALIIILTRAGLSLKVDNLKKVGRAAILLCFLPATFEIVGYMLFAPLILGLTILESALMGTVMGAVSPAIVIPCMLNLQEKGYGEKKAIPQMIMAGASCDDIFVIVLFTALLTSFGSGNFNFNIIWQIPVSIILGISVGMLVGWVFSTCFKHFYIRNTVKIIIMLSFSFLLVSLENLIKTKVPFSGLLAIISFSMMINIKQEELAKELSNRYEKLWVFAEIILFVLVGASINISYALTYGVSVIIVLFSALVFRMIGVFVCLFKTSLNFKEKLFCAIAYIPKATVQAAIGAIPLSIGLECGEMILTCAVLAILITAPLGAFATNLLYKKLL